MTELPPGIERRDFGGESALATHGSTVYGEPTSDGWRRWSRDRSKLAVVLDHGVDIGLGPDATVLYLGAAAGTTASHVADVCQVVYAVEFAPRPMRDLLDAVPGRPLIPLLADARQPEQYSHVVEHELDVLIQDVATRGQAHVAVANRQFLATGGRLVLSIKARSEDVSARPEAVYASVREELNEHFEILEHIDLDPHHVDHQVVIATPRS